MKILFNAMQLNYKLPRYSIILLLYALCTLIFNSVKAQDSFILKDTSSFYINNFYQLADNNYTFEQVLNDSNLPFKKDSLFILDKKGSFWIKATIQNHAAYDKSFALMVAPLFNTTMYYYNHEAKQWHTKQGGYYNSNFYTESRKYIACTFKANTATTLYFKTSVQPLLLSKYAINTFIIFRPIQLVENQLNQQIFLWAITISVVLAFFLYNVYLYFMFKDKSYLYYLLITVSGIFYITADNGFISFFTGIKYLNAAIVAQGVFYITDFDYFARQYITIALFIGFLQFARTYLQTKTLMPLWDKVLKLTNITQIVISIIINITLCTGLIKYLPFISAVQNVLYGIMLLILLTVGLVAAKNKNPQAKYYLLAQGLCIITMLVLVGYLFGNKYQVEGMPILPNIAILIQTLAFAVALVARVNFLKEDLFHKKLVAEQSASQLAVQQTQNKMLEDKIEYNKKELAAAEQIKLLLKEIHHRVKNNLQIISSLLYMQFKDNKDEHMLAQLKQAQERIKSMALVHNKLYETSDVVHVYLKEYIADLAGGILSSNTPAGKNIHLHIVEQHKVNLSLDTSISIGLILNELITNSCKYAFTSMQQGNITITFTQQDNNVYSIQVNDDGTGLPQNYDQKNSLGLRLVKNLARQLGGNVNFNSQNGTQVFINFKDAAAA